MAKLGFILSPKDFPPLSEQEWEELRESYDAEGELTPLGRAVAFTRAGIPVFPCRTRDETDPRTGEVKEAKSPYVSGGFKAATTDEAQTRKRWRKWRDALIGIPTGKITNTVVLDVDEREDRSGFESLAQAGIKLPSTVHNQTRNNGLHGFYRRPEVEEFPGRNGILPGLDMKADGGYVIAWNNLGPKDLQAITPFPEGLIEALEAARQAPEPGGADPAPQAAGHAADHSPKDVPDSRMRTAALAALQGRAADLAKTQHGSQNDALLSGVRYISPKIAHGWLSQDEVYQAFRAAYEANGYIQKDGADAFDRTFASGLSKLVEDASKPLPNLKERPRTGGVASGVSGPSHVNGAPYEPGPNGAAPGSSAGPEAKAKVEDQPLAWGDPQPIDAPLHPVDEFDAKALLPESVRDCVVDAAWRMPCAVDYIAASVIVALGSIIGARVGIKPKRLDDWVVVPNLWGAVVGDPSQKKSPGATLPPRESR